MTHLINRSLVEGVFPCNLKVSRTVPIYKGGDSRDMANYRPISCLPILSKIYKKIVFNQLYNYLTVNKILSPSQFGFQPGKGTIHPLISMLNYIANAFNNNKFVVAVFLDLSKAFDLVRHDILLDKLKRIGLDNISIDWFTSYLSNRQMYTSINGVLSTKANNLTRSVAQGSILGPLLFLIFINDLPISNLLDSFIYADDTSALTSGTDINETGLFVNEQLQKLSSWLRSNELCINSNKTKIMVFSNKKFIPDFPFVLNFNEVGNESSDPNLVIPLERIKNSSSTPAFKILGVFMDEHLTFNYHIKKIINKINSAMFHISSVRNFLSKSSLTKLYYALVHPHILYCLPVYSFTSLANRKKIITKQKQCIRIIHNTKYNAHTEPLFVKSQILPFNDLVTQQKLTFMHAIFYGYSTVHFPDFQILSAMPNVHYQLRNADDFFVCRTNSTFIKNMPLIDFPNTWNNLDNGYKEIRSKLLFKKTIKSDLLDKYCNFRCNKIFCVSCMPIA